MDIIFLILGLFGLFVGSGYVVKSCKAIARRFGVSELLIGITIVSIGTSLPEIMVSIFSGASGVSDIAIGTMIGSSFAQMTLILGISGMIHNVRAQKKALQVDGPMILVAIFVFGILLYTDGELTRFEGFLMIWIYLAYIWFTLRNDTIRANKQTLGAYKPTGKPIIYRIGQFLIGLTVLLTSARFVLNGVTTIANEYGLSTSFLGIMVVGIATCLPELSTAVSGMRHNSPSIAVGTLIGSSITNPLLATGIGALIGGFQTNMNLIKFDVPFWFVTAGLALILLSARDETLHKSQATILIAMYGVFMIFKLGIVAIPEWMYLF